MRKVNEAWLGIFVEGLRWGTPPRKVRCDSIFFYPNTVRCRKPKTFYSQIVCGNSFWSLMICCTGLLLGMASILLHEVQSVV